MIADTIRIVPGAGLIVTVGFFVLAVIIQAASKNKNTTASQVALSTIRHCASCRQVVGQSATECRHCLAVLPALPAPIAAGRWSNDPFNRHELRYWDGAAWTNHVSDAGVSAVDEPSP
jgi:Protein of unknown function (DUF2510)